MRGPPRNHQRPSQPAIPRRAAAPPVGAPLVGARLPPAPPATPPLTTPNPLPYHQRRTYVPRPANRGRAERGRQTTQRRTQPDRPPTPPSRCGAIRGPRHRGGKVHPGPSSQRDHKPGGSSRLSPATRRRPASVTATDGKDPAPPYRGPGDQSPPSPRGARTAGLASPSVVDRTVRSVIPDGARNDRPAWPGPQGRTNQRTPHRETRA